MKKVRFQLIDRNKEKGSKLSRCPCGCVACRFGGVSA
jgi:hypothetical protein